MNKLSVLLTDEQSAELQKYIFDIAKEGISQARKSAGLDRPFLRQKYMAEWLGVSVNSLKKLESEGLPSITLDGLKFFSKEETTKWLMQHQK